MEANASAAFDLNSRSTHTSTFFIPSDLVVASPVEDYFIHIDDLPDDEKVCLIAILISFVYDKISSHIYLMAFLI